MKLNPAHCLYLVGCPKASTEKRLPRIFIFIAACTLVVTANAQQRLSLDEAIQTALSKNEGLRSAESQVDYFKELRKTSGDIGKLSAVWMHGQYNSVYQDNNLTLMQTLPFPTAISSQWQLGNEQVVGAERNLQSDRNTLVFDVKSSYYTLLYLEAFAVLLRSQDSLYSDFVKAATLRYSTGDGNLLEKTNAETQQAEIANLGRQNQADIVIAATHLRVLLKSEAPVMASEILRKRELPASVGNVDNNPQLVYLLQQVIIRDRVKRVERNRIFPDISVGYFVQSLTGLQNVNGQDIYYNRSKHFQGFELGLSIPVWIGPQLAKVRAAAAYEEVARRSADYYQTTLTGNYEQASRELDKTMASLAYYEKSALPAAALILSQARRAYAGGEIGYVEYLQSLKNVVGIRSNYLANLNQYNQSVVKIEFLLGKF